MAARNLGVREFRETSDRRVRAMADHIHRARIDFKTGSQHFSGRWILIPSTQLRPKAVRRKPQEAAGPGQITNRHLKLMETRDNQDSHDPAEQRAICGMSSPCLLR